MSVLNTQPDPPDRLIEKPIELFHSDQLSEMLDEIERLLLEYPKSSKLFNLQGSAHFKLQRFDRAAISFRNALQIDPVSLDILLNLVKTHRKNSDLDSAKKCIRDFLIGSPDSADAYFHLGVLEQQTGEVDTAIELFETSIRLNPEFAGAYHNMGLIWANKENWQKAIHYYERAISANPNSPKFYNNLGVAFQTIGDYKASERALISAISLDNNFLEAILNLADTLRLDGKLEQAKINYESAIRIDSDCSRSYVGRGICLQKQEMYDLAVESFRRALSIEPGNADCRFKLGITYIQLNRYELALEEIEKSITLNPNFVAAHKNRCELLEKMNRLEELERALTEGIDAIGEKSSELGYFQARLSYRKKNYDTALAQIESSPFTSVTGDEIVRSLKLKADCQNALGHFKAAFGTYTEMNREIRTTSAFDWTSADYYFSRVAAHAKILSEMSRASFQRNSDEPPIPAPVFLIGFPRSGTTLLDTILRTHSKITVVEEKPTMSRTLESVKHGIRIEDLENLSAQDKQQLRRRYFEELNKHTDFQNNPCTIDKMPLNIIHAPVIAQLFPHAKFIFTIRHPLDCILSCFMQNFKLNAAMGNMLDLSRIVALYCNSMHLWDLSNARYGFDVKEVRYEDLIRDFQHEVSGLVNFLELEWEDSLSDYRSTAEKRGRIHTPSYSQVVQPIYNSASYRWRNYKAELKEYFDEIQPWVTRFNYEI